MKKEKEVKSKNEYVSIVYTRFILLNFNLILS